jgi:hypothetical protein
MTMVLTELKSDPNQSIGLVAVSSCELTSRFAVRDRRQISVATCSCGKGGLAG